MPAQRYDLAPGLSFDLDGDAGDVAQLGLEYAPVRAAPTGGREASVDAANLAVRFATGPAGGTGPRIDGGHKTVRWSVALSAADVRPTTMDVGLAGLPRSVVRSMVQGAYVESVLSVVAAEAGWVLLPSAGIVTGDGLQVLVGMSGAGKSTLAARALAAGREVLGDDQLLVDAAGRWLPFPRRLRCYPDLARTAPAAWAALPARVRARLRATGWLARLTRGYVRPSTRVDRASLGGAWTGEPRRAARIVLLERSPDVAEVALDEADADTAVRWAERVLLDQRSRLLRVDDPAWQARIAAAAEREVAILREAIGAVPVSRVRIPASWPAPRAVLSTERALRLGP